MKRAVLMSAASAFCFVWAAGCSSTGHSDVKPAATATVEKPADENPSASSDIATLTKNLPGTMEGEIKRAKLLREKGDFAEAERSLAQLMLVAPDDGIVVGEYGKVLEQEGRSQEALGFLKRAVQLQPRDWALYSSLGVAYDQLDKHADARAAYERALVLKPGEPGVLNNYAVSRMLAGDYAGAQRLLAEASAHGGDNAKIGLNTEKLASLRPAPAPAPVAVPPAASAKPVPPPPAVKVAVLPPATLQPAAAKPAPAPPAATKPAAAPPPKPTTSASAAASHAPLAVFSVKAQQPGVVMQRVPVDPLATRSGAAHSGGATAAISSQHPAATHAPLAIVAAKSLGPNVVMQRVPFDPLAGPVAAHKPAHKAAPAAAKPAVETPSLRTAADTGN